MAKMKTQQANSRQSIISFCLIRPLISAVILIGISHTAAAQGIKTVVITGQPATGAPAGAVFSGFTNPSINNAGEVAFNAILAVGPGGIADSNDTGIWAGTSAGLRLVASEGSQTPDTPTGAVFDTLFDTSEAPVINDCGQVAFKKQLREGAGGVNSSNKTGIWCEKTGTLMLVMRQGSHAPGTGDGVIFDGSVTKPLLNNMGQVGFWAALVPGAGGVVSGENDGGIWLGAPGEVSIIIREWESPAPGFPSGVNFQALYNPAMNNAGELAFTGWTRTGMAGVTSLNNNGCWAGASGCISLIARESFTAPTGFSGETYDTIGTGLWPVVINKWGKVAFTGKLRAVAFSPSQYYDGCIWSNGTTDLWTIAREGFNFPGMPENSGFASFVGYPVICDAGSIGFVGQLQPGWGGVTDANDECIFAGVAYTGENESLRVVAREGDTAPGTPGWKFEANLLYAFYNTPMMNAIGEIAFASDDLIYHEAGQIKHFWGVWATNPLGELVLVARTGSQIEVSPGVFKTVSDIKAGHYPSSGGGDGRPRGLNDAGQIAFWAQFTDGSAGIFTADLNVQGKTAAIAYGSNQSGSLIGGSGTAGGVDITFAQTTGGIVWGNFNEISLEDFLDSLGNTESGWPFDYIDFGPASDPVQLWDIGFTGTSTGKITVTFGYRDTDLSAEINEENLVIFHFTGGKWVVLGGVVDTFANTITVQTDGFSYFALGAVVPDCTVNTSNFARFAQQWLDSGSGLAADLNWDNHVDTTDLGLFINRWLQPCPLGWPLK